MDNNANISIILFGKPKDFEIYELTNSGIVNNIYNYYKGPTILPISTNYNVFHLFKLDNFYYYEIYTEAFAKKEGRKGNLIGMAIKSDTQLLINKLFVRKLIAVFSQYKDVTVKNNSFSMYNLKTELIDKINIKGFFESFVKSENENTTWLEFADKSINNAIAKKVQLINADNLNINGLDLNYTEYYISEDKELFEHRINFKPFEQCGREVFMLDYNGNIVKKAAVQQNNERENLRNKLHNEKDVDKKDEIIKDLFKLNEKEHKENEENKHKLKQETIKLEKSKKILIVSFILLALGIVSFIIYAGKKNREIDGKDTELIAKGEELSEKGTTITTQEEAINQLAALNNQIKSAEAELDRKLKSANASEADLREENLRLQNALDKKNREIVSEYINIKYISSFVNISPNRDVITIHSDYIKKTNCQSVDLSMYMPIKDCENQKNSIKPGQGSGSENTSGSQEKPVISHGTTLSMKKNDILVLQADMECHWIITKEGESYIVFSGGQEKSKSVTIKCNATLPSKGVVCLIVKNLSNPDKYVHITIKKKS